MIVKSIERNAAGLHDARRRLLGQAGDDELLPPAPTHAQFSQHSLAEIGGILNPGLLQTSPVLVPVSLHSPNSYITSRGEWRWRGKEGRGVEGGGGG